jgi:RNA polymerase sigma-70 factor (ECF subfamily)
MTSVDRRRHYERLARRLYAGVYNYLRWLGGDAELAKDLTQETFVQVWRHLPDLRRQQAADSWVYRIARNQFLQHHRRAAPQMVSLGDWQESEAAGLPGVDGESLLERRWICQSVRDATDRLPELYREVIALHSLEGLTLSQVAEVLAIPEGTVKSRLSKAFAMLRETLAAEVKCDEMPAG